MPRASPTTSSSSRHPGRDRQAPRGVPRRAAGATGTPALSNDEMLTAFRDSTVAGRAGLRADAGAAARDHPARARDARHAGGADDKPGLVARAHHGDGGTPVRLLGDVRLAPGGHRDRLRHLHPSSATRKSWRWASRRARRSTVTARRTGPGILFGALDAAGTFGVLMLTEFRGIQEFGFIAGISVLVAFVAMMTLFPAALLVLPRRRARRRAARMISAASIRGRGPRDPAAAATPDARAPRRRPGDGGVAGGAALGALRLQPPGPAGARARSR